MFTRSQELGQLLLEALLEYQQKRDTNDCNVLPHLTSMLPVSRKHIMNYDTRSEEHSDRSQSYFCSCPRFAGIDQTNDR